MSRHSALAKQLFKPLTEAELEELDQFLLSSITSDETLSLDALDGYLTAIIVGPTTLSFNQWYPYIWGPSDEDIPDFASQEQAQHILELIIRHYNGIIAVLGHDPDAFEPIFDTLLTHDGAEHFNGEMWAYGFMDGVKLCLEDWQPLVQDKDGVQALLPIFLMGSDNISPEQEKLVETQAQCIELTHYIPDSVAWIYRFWQPYRLAMAERTSAKQARRDGVKVGRNDPCPCGSGKKFKKCCGIAAVLH